MSKIVYKSKCCRANVSSGGTPDFPGSNEICTVNFICLNCGKACDVVSPKITSNRTVKKSNNVLISVNDDIEVRLTREGLRIYKKYCNTYRYSPMKKTAERWFRVHLWEFMHIFGSRMFMGATAVVVKNIIRIPK